VEVELKPETENPLAVWLAVLCEYEEAVGFETDCPNPLSVIRKHRTKNKNFFIIIAS
jgi:hypothetical protein